MRVSCVSEATVCPLGALHAFCLTLSVDEVVRPQRYLEGSNLLPRWLVDRLGTVQFGKVIHLHENAILVPGLAGALPTVHTMVLLLNIILIRCSCPRHRERIHEPAAAHGRRICPRYARPLVPLSAPTLQVTHRPQRSSTASRRTFRHIRTRATSRAAGLRAWAGTRLSGPEHSSPPRYVAACSAVFSLYSSCVIDSVQADLVADPLLKGRLISLSRVDGHARWVSPAVLDLMPNLPKQVEGGLIVRDAEGNPTGTWT